MNTLNIHYQQFSLEKIKLIIINLKGRAAHIKNSI
jgi:hypothetical protein